MDGVAADLRAVQSVVGGVGERAVGKGVEIEANVNRRIAGKASTVAKPAAKPAASSTYLAGTKNI